MIKDMTGLVYGRLTCLRCKGTNKKGEAVWLCRCSCGNLVRVKGSAIRNGNTRSCGCLRRDVAKRTTLIRLGLPLHDRTYRTWKSVITKSETKSIPIDNKWLQFVGFLDDMGEKPGDDWFLAYNKKNGFFKGSCLWKLR